LIEIAKTSTDPRVRSQAIQALTRRKDPKATAFIRDLVEKP
jgi:HEAT repeat protein